MIKRFVIAASCVTVLFTSSAVVASAQSVDATDEPASERAYSLDVRAQDVVDHIGPINDIGQPESTSGLSSTRKGQVRASTSVTPNGAIVTFSPAGCKGSTDYPHKTDLTYASVHGKTQCNAIVAYVEVSTDLYRDRWYGEEFLKNGFSSRDHYTWSGEATPHWLCLGTGEYSYRGYSTHRSLEGATWYYASTSNWQLPGISRFICW